MFYYPEFTELLLNSKSKKVLLICGSLREGSFHRRLLNTLPELAPKGMEFVHAPTYRGVPIFDADNFQSSGVPAQIEAISDAIESADGVIIASPEYNHSVPGGLKNVLDWISRRSDQPLKGKPVALQSASPGPVGGVRGQMAMRQTLLFFQANVMVKPEVMIGLAEQRFDETRLTDPKSQEFVTAQLAAFSGLIMKSAA